MNKRFRVCDLNQPLLLPPSLQDWLPQDHLARFPRQAYVIAHELAHVEYGQTPGGQTVLNVFYQNGQYLEKKFGELGIQPALKDPEIQKLNQQQLDTGHRLEEQADQRAWEVVKP